MNTISSSSSSFSSVPKVLVGAYACLRDPNTDMPGGGDLMAWEFLTRLARHCELWVLTSSINMPLIEAELEREPCPSLHFCYLELPSWFRLLHRIPGGIQFNSYLWQWRALFTAYQLHRRIRFDAFHHLTYENDWMAIPIGVLLPIPYLRGPGGGAHRTPMEFVGRYPLGGRLWERFRSIGQWLLRHDPFFILGQRRAKAILVCNHEALEAIPESLRHKAQLFPVNGVSPEAISDRSLPVCHNIKFRVLSAGRLVRLKAFDLSVRAFKQFADRADTAAPHEELELVLVGDGPERNRLEALSHSLGLEGMVQFVGWKPRTELWEMMRTADVFLFPSLRDGGGHVVVEAMAAGTPVVCADLGGPGMHITNECGFKVKPFTPEQLIADLATALGILHRDPELRLRMGRAALRRVQQVYVWDQLAKSLLTIYEKVLNLTFEQAISDPALQENNATR